MGNLEEIVNNNKKILEKMVLEMDHSLRILPPYIENIEVAVEICRDDVKLPEYANENDAGMDVRSAVNITINPGETVCIPTGLKFAIPKGYEIQVRPRSGLSLKTPLRVSNSPGTVDANFRGEVGIILENRSPIDEYSITYSLNANQGLPGIFEIKKGDRIAQLVLNKVPRMSFKVVDDILECEGNRGGGFGSSGIK